MLDDDLIEYRKFIVLGKKRSTKEVSFTEIVKTLKHELDKTDFKLAGTTISTNAFWYNEVPIKYRGLITGATMMIKPCELRFDTNFKMKEDVDYSLNHITVFGGLVFINNVFGKFKHNMIFNNKGDVKNENEGGVVRDINSEKIATKLIKKKWSNLVKDNPRISTAVLLRPLKIKKVKEINR